MVLFQIDLIKALGSGGFPMPFCQKHWDIIRGKLVPTCMEILNGKFSVARFSQTFITLILKKNIPQIAVHFRPIRLCNVVYKIMAKVFANRLKLVLSNIISETQSSFVFWAVDYQ